MLGYSFFCYQRQIRIPVPDKTATTVVTSPDKQPQGVKTDLSQSTNSEQDLSISNEIEIFLIRNDDPECAVYAVKRSTTGCSPVLAISLLLQGPTEKERKLGFNTAIPDKTKLVNTNIKAGKAYVEFNKELNVGGGSTYVTLIRDQIEQTLKNLRCLKITDVEIGIQGMSIDEVLQP